MALERLVYCSRAKVPTESLLVIADILAVSQRNNDRDRLTGALAICEGWFLQVLEGETVPINQLLRRLDADPRHTDVEILSRKPIATRLFSAWSMASARVTQDLRSDLVSLIDECRADPESATAALLEIVAARQ